ncbi:MAG: CBS domain-containing protein [Thermoleophilaceae bacterium]
MPDRIARQVLRRPAPVVRAEDLVAPAVRKVLDAGLPGLPVVDADGGYAGVFGTRELIGAVFPRYLEQLRGTTMISPALDEVLERRLECAGQPVREHLDSEHPVVDEGFSDTQLAELFLHHRVQIVPVLSGGRAQAVVPAEGFFRELGRLLLGDAA